MFLHVCGLPKVDHMFYNVCLGPPALRASGRRYAQMGSMAQLRSEGLKKSIYLFPTGGLRRFRPPHNSRPSASVLD